MRTQLIIRWGTQILISSLTITSAILGKNYPTIATEVTPKSENSAQDLQPIAQTEEKEPDIEITVIDSILNEPVFSPFRREGTVLTLGPMDSTNKAFKIVANQVIFLW